MRWNLHISVLQLIDIVIGLRVLTILKGISGNFFVFILNTRNIIL